MKSVHDWVDIERLEGPCTGQGSLLMSNIKRSIVKPNICFDGHCTERNCTVEGHVSPVVIVAVDRFRYNTLGQDGWIGV